MLEGGIVFTLVEETNMNIPEWLPALQAKTRLGFVTAFRFWLQFAASCLSHPSPYTMDRESVALISISTVGSQTMAVVRLRSCPSSGR